MDLVRKENLREVNLQVWDGFEDGQTSPNLGLDSSLKKNTAFIKRLRTSINPASLPLFQQDIQTLSIQKYLSELISAFCEGCLRLKTADEFGVACEIASALHQRFGPDAFTRVFAFLIRRAVTVVAADRTPVKQAVLEQKDRDEKDRSIRQRTLLRLITELWLVGVLRSIDDSYSGDDLPQARLTKAVAAPGRAIHRKANGTPLLRGNQDEPFPLATLKDLLEQDRYHNNLSLAVFFAKYYALQFLGVQPSKPDAEAVLQQIGDQSTEQDGLKHSIQQDDPVVSRTLQVRFKNVLTNYYEKLSMALVNGQIALGEQARRNAEIAVKTGQLFEDRQENYEKQVKEQERLVASGHVLSEILGMAMPNLNHSVEDGLADISIGLVKKGDFLGKRDGPGIWEDEEERRFYEKLIDLRERVPMILLEDPKKKHADDLAPLGNRPKSSQSLDGGSISMQTDANHRDLTVDLVESSESDLSTPEISNRTTGSQVDALLARLPSLMVKEAADQLAIAFCFLNSKASRNRLLKALQEVPKGRIDLLPLYARLATTLGRYFADILENMIVYLHSEFRSLQRRKDKDFLSQVRTGNVRYLAELIKFGAVPDHVIFHCLKVSLDDFSRMNIELMAVLLENCGRYLLRNHDTSAQMMNFMEALRRRKGAQHLGQQEKMLVENTIYFVNPPERAAIEQKERSPIELFVHKLVYEDMTKTSYPTVFKLLRKLHWEETDIWTMILKVFTRPWKIKYSDTYLLAILVSSSYRYHPDLAVQVVDDTMEQIVSGLEMNSFSDNQKRISQVRYLAELYVYKVVDSTLIFETLHRLVSFGRGPGSAESEGSNEIDLPDDFFRIQLICNILQVCGTCFARGSAAKRLDDFIILFQHYILTKDAMPIDIDFLLQDTFSKLRPSWKLPASQDEAFRILCQTFVHSRNRPVSPKAAAEETQAASESSGSEADDEETETTNITPRRSAIKEEESLASQTNGHLSSSDEDEHLVVKRADIAKDPAEEMEFDRELAQLMSSSVEQRKFERRPVFDMPLPIKKKVISSGSGSDSDSGRGTPPNTVAFSLMTKKGNRQQTKSIELPSNSAFAVAMRDRQLAERAEQQRIKNLVLNYDLS